MSATDPLKQSTFSVTAGGYSARCVAPDDVAHRLCSLLVDLVTPDPVAAGRIEVDHAPDGCYIIRSDGRLWNDTVPEADLPDQVVRMLLWAALDAESTLVHIHAGSVTLQERTLVLAGWPASGKSTAIAALVSSGFSYVTDERLVLSSDGLSVAGFPKPISLIAGSFDVFPDLDPERTGRGASNGTTWQIPASSVGPVAPLGFRAPSVLVFIDYRQGAPLRVSTVAPVEAAARLLGDSPDVVARGYEGANAIVSLVVSTPSVEVEYSATDELVPALRDLLKRSAPITTVESIGLKGIAVSDDPAPGSPAAIDTARSFAITDAASVWIIDDRALAYLHRSGHVVELDEANAAWLQLLDPERSIDELIGEIAGETETDADAVRSAARQAVYSLWGAGVIGPTTGT